METKKIVTPAERRENKDFLLNLVMEDVEDEEIKMEFRKLTELQAEVKQWKVEAEVRAKMEAMSTTTYPLLDNKPAVNPATAPGPLITTQQAGAVGFVAPALLAPDAFLLGTVIDELLTAEELEEWERKLNANKKKRRVKKDPTQKQSAHKAAQNSDIKDTNVQGVE